MGRRLLLLILLAAAAELNPLHAQGADPSNAVARVGYVDPESRATALWGWPAFWQRLRELGWIEGRNLIVEARFADGHVDRLPGLMTKVIGRKVDVIFTYTFPGAVAAKTATGTNPIVAVMSDPVGSGFAASLARPGGNLTGVSTAWDEGRGGKWLELLQEAVPGLHTVAVISDPADGFSGLAAKQLEAAAHQFDRLKTGGYTPIAHGRIEMEQNSVRNLALQVLAGDRTLKMDIASWPVNNKLSRIRRNGRARC